MTTKVICKDCGFNENFQCSENARVIRDAHRNGIHRGCSRQEFLENAMSKWHAKIKLGLVEKPKKDGEK